MKCVLRASLLGRSILLLVCIVSAWPLLADARKDVDDTLTRFHQAASKADGKTYFDLFAPEGVFIGTDATERWTVGEFRAYAEPHFSKGHGWTYLSKVRHIDFDPSQSVAWFDELLDNKSLGLCRGSGVLRKVDGAWKVAQYHLTIPVPNDMADVLADLVAGKFKLDAVRKLKGPK